MSSNAISIKVWIQKVYEVTEDGQHYSILDLSAPYHLKYTAVFFDETGTKVVEAPSEELLKRAIEDELIYDFKVGEKLELVWQEPTFIEMNLVMLKSSE